MTNGKKRHFIHTGDAFSPDDNWLVYDARNDDAHIGMSKKFTNNFHGYIIV